MSPRISIGFVPVILGAALLGGCAGNAKPGRGPVESRVPADTPFLVNVDSSGVALMGYDPVAFFTDARPVMGDPKNRTAYKGAIYQFASAEHQRMFESDPLKYEPQFGGFCGYAASINKVSPTDVNYWEIIDGRLVLQHNDKAWKLWHEDVAGNLKKADQNWPSVVRENGI
jgi:YHS domain-containing protein